MAIFGSKKAKTEVVAKVVKPAIVDSSVQVIIRPHITEKSGIASQNGVYTFIVDKNANKPVVAKAVKNLYKVTPVKITIVNLPAKNVFIRGKKGVVSGMRKAIVTLKKGDKIDFV